MESWVSGTCCSDAEQKLWSWACEPRETRIRPEIAWDCGLMPCQGVRGSYKGRSSVSMTLFNCLAQCCIGQFLLTMFPECDPVWALLFSLLHIFPCRRLTWPDGAPSPGLAWLGPIMSLTGFHFVGTWTVTQRGNCYFHHTPHHIPHVLCPVRGDLGFGQLS